MRLGGLGASTIVFEHAFAAAMLACDTAGDLAVEFLTLAGISAKKAMSAGCAAPRSVAVDAAVSSAGTAG